MTRGVQEAAPNGAQAIRAAAAELFSRSGFDAVSVAEIAERAGVCKANVFHHFESKEALYLEVMREACRGHAEFTEALLPQALPSAEKLRRMVAFDFAQMFENPQRTRLAFREVLNAGCGQGRRLAEQVFRRNFVAVAALMRQGQERGEFRAELDPGVAAWVLGAAVMMFFQNREVIPHLPGMKGMEGPQLYAERVFDLLLGGVLAGAAAAPKHRKRSTGG